MVWELAGFEMPPDQALREAGLDDQGAPDLGRAPSLRCVSFNRCAII